MFLTGLDAEDVAGEVECANLPAAIVEKAERSHNARNDLIGKIRGLTLAKYLAIALELHAKCWELNTRHELDGF
jgi:hypothetical protein